MSLDEKRIWNDYGDHVWICSLTGKRPLSFDGWCASEVINPAPLIAWYEKHKAKKH